MTFNLPKWIIHFLTALGTVAAVVAAMAAAIPSVSVGAPFIGVIAVIAGAVFVAAHAGINVLTGGVATVSIGAPLTGPAPAAFTDLHPALADDMWELQSLGRTHSSVLRQILDKLDKLFDCISILIAQGEPVEPPVVAPGPPVVGPPVVGPPVVGPPVLPPTPPSPVQTVVWFNESKASLSDADAASIIAALNLQVPDLVAAWGTSYTDTHVLRSDPTAPLAPGEWPAYFLPSSDVAGALAYHDVDPQGRAYSRVFVDTILANAGTILGPGGVSVAASHEACEMAVDPSCTITASALNGDTWAVEVCDPVESNSYPVSLTDGTVVCVSDFVGPDFFIPTSTGSFDKMGVITSPFAIAAGGYAIINNVSVFGAVYPAWKVAGKLFPAARTARRTGKVLQTV